MTVHVSLLEVGLCMKFMSETSVASGLDEKKTVKDLNMNSVWAFLIYYYYYYIF